MCALLLAVAPACGEEESSGVDSDTTFDELSTQQLRAICDWWIDLLSVDDLVTYGCYLEALTASLGDRERCEALADACLEEAESWEGELSCAFRTDLGECASQITVGQIESCIEAQVSQQSDIAAEISCDSVLEEVDLTQIAMPPACRVVEERCPGF